MITATDLEVRAGARTLVYAPGPALRIQPGDRIGLVGRNGAGKTTSMRILAGEGEPYAGSVSRIGEIGYLPQDPKEGNLDLLARDRVLSARGLDTIISDMEKQQTLMAELADEAQRDKAVRRYGQLEERFSSLGGYVAESEAARICSSLGLPERVLIQPLRTLSGGQRRRVELARILFGAAEGGAGSNMTLLLDEPTNHLDADSIGWLRGFLQNHEGGLVVISHNVELLADVVNKVWFLDAVRGEVDVYNMGWQKYLDARSLDEQRRRRERANAEKKASALRTQAAKMGAKATKAVAAQNMLRRAEKMLSGLDEERVADKVARIKFPTPAACGRVPLVAKGLTRTTDLWRSSPGWIWPSIAARGSWFSDSTARGRRRCCGCSRAPKPPTPARWSPATASSSDTSHRSTTPWTITRRCGRTSATPLRIPGSRSYAESWVPSCSTAHSWSSRRGRCPAVRRPAWPWPVWSRRPRMCCCSMSRPTTWIPPRVNRF